AKEGRTKNKEKFTAGHKSTSLPCHSLSKHNKSVRLWCSGQLAPRQRIDEALIATTKEPTTIPTILESLLWVSCRRFIKVIARYGTFHLNGSPDKIDACDQADNRAAS
ncbi:MAG: hypothetical protein PVJ75_13645, partial [Chloroflexota bacterium]